MGEIKSTIAMFPFDFTELVGLLATQKSYVPEQGAIFTYML
jgi:hypothetical protein